ncbi:MAG: CapA family protein [Gammaproteobacteria bacterium]|nr:CapA family protein [Gammaproteobacteria bacterium]
MLQPAPRDDVVRTRISAVGDIMLDGTARPYLQRYGYDHPFVQVRSLFAESDLVIGNLEGPLTTASVPLVEKKFLFRSPAQPVAAALARAGIGAVSLANNHALDYGFIGLRDTIAALRGAGIEFFGAGETLHAARAPAIVDTGRVKIGMLGYSNTFPQEFWADEFRGGTAFGHEEQVRADVLDLARGVDVVVVSFHWGREGSTELRPYQPLLARAAIDAGADLVIGHHPHVLQEIERYRDGVILYSLGNFAFGSFSARATVGAIAHVEFVDGKFAELALQPLNVDNFSVYFQPRPLAAQQALETFDHLRILSLSSGTLLHWRGGEIVHSAVATPALSSSTE